MYKINFLYNLYMSNPTYKSLIEKKYKELIEDINKIIPSIQSHIENEFLPKIEDNNINWAELIQYIEFLFPDDNTGYNLNELFEFKNIDVNEEQIILLIPIIDKYLKFMKTIKKYLISK